MGYDDNLADYVTKRKSRPDEAIISNITSTSDSTAQNATPTQTASTRLTNHSYSFSKSTRTSKPGNKSRPTSRSVSPAKPNTMNSRSSKAMNTLPTSSAITSATPVTKPSSPLTAFHLTSQTSKPTTSTVTVSTAGIVASLSSPSSMTSTLRRSPVEESSRRSTVVTSTNPSINLAGFDTIVEGDEMETPIITRGSAESYKDSPMVKLMEQYSGEEDGADLSTEAWVTLLATKDNLEPELIERVEDLNKGITKYKLLDDFLEELSKMSTELQVFVEKAAGLLQERTRHFIVNPKDTLIHILKGTSSLPQLNVAWKTIQRHLELGNRTLNKYMQQYQLDPHTELLLSPISTLPDLHEGLNDLHTADQRLRFLYQKFPNHHEQLPEQAEVALSQGKSWMNVLPLPTTWKNVFIPDKESPPETSERHASKGKQKEIRESTDEEDGEQATHIWLGSETPFKGPNKWFGGGRLRARESLSEQKATRSNKMNQNVLFGIATPQIPIWAAEPSASSKQPKASHSLQLREWTEREPPPHIPARRESSATHQGGRHSNNDPPDDDGNGGNENGDGNAHHGPHCPGR